MYDVGVITSAVGRSHAHLRCDHAQGPARHAPARTATIDPSGRVAGDGGKGERAIDAAPAVVEAREGRGRDRAPASRGRQREGRPNGYVEAQRLRGGVLR